MKTVQILISISLTILLAEACYADLSGMYYEQSANEICLLQIEQNGSYLDGSFQEINADVFDPQGYKMLQADVTGSIQGSRLTIHSGGGILGQSPMLSGRFMAGSIIIDVPQPNGQIMSPIFKPTTTTHWNRIVSDFESRMGQAYALTSTYLDEWNTIQGYSKARDRINSDLNQLQDTVKDLKSAWINQATAETDVDQANAAHQIDIKAMASAQNSMNAAQSAMNAVEAQESSDQSDQAKYQADQANYQTQLAAYNNGMQSYQTAEQSWQNSDQHLYSVMNSSPLSLWHCTLRVWQDVDKINTLHNDVLTQESSAKTSYSRAYADHQQVQQLKSVLGGAKKPLSEPHFLSPSAMSQAFKLLDNELANLMPSLPTPLASHSGTVCVDSAAIRNYNPYGDSALRDVEMVATMTKGQQIENIFDQTHNDYYFKMPDGTKAEISKADIALSLN